MTRFANLNEIDYHIFNTIYSVYFGKAPSEDRVESINKLLNINNKALMYMSISEDEAKIISYAHFWGEITLAQASILINKNTRSTLEIIKRLTYCILIKPNDDDSFSPYSDFDYTPYLISDFSLPTDIETKDYKFIEHIYAVLAYINTTKIIVRQNHREKHIQAITNMFHLLDKEDAIYIYDLVFSLGETYKFIKELHSTYVLDYKKVIKFFSNTNYDIIKLVLNEKYYKYLDYINLFGKTPILDYSDEGIKALKFYSRETANTVSAIISSDMSVMVNKIKKDSFIYLFSQVEYVDNFSTYTINEQAITNALSQRISIDEIISYITKESALPATVESRLISYGDNYNRFNPEKVILITLDPKYLILLESWKTKIKYTKIDERRILITNSEIDEMILFCQKYKIENNLFSLKEPENHSLTIEKSDLNHLNIYNKEFELKEQSNYSSLEKLVNNIKDTSIKNFYTSLLKRNLLFCAEQININIYTPELRSATKLNTSTIYYIIQSNLDSKKNVLYHILTKKFEGDYHIKSRKAETIQLLDDENRSFKINITDIILIKELDILNI